MIVRKAKRSDSHAAINLLHGEYLAAGFDRVDGPSGMSFPFERVRAHTHFEFHLLSLNTVCFVLEKDETVRGILMASFASHPFCGARIAHPQGWFIETKHRGASVASRMLDAYEAWAREKGCVYAGAATMSGNPRVGVLYERRGYRPAESYFLKVL